MKRLSFSITLVLLLLLVQAGAVSAVSPEPASGRAGGNIFFDTTPPDATIWVDNVRIGTSPCTYYTENNGTLNVRIQKKYFEDYSGTVSVDNGQRVVFSAILTRLPTDISRTDTPAPVAIVTTVAAIETRSAITVPTPWPSTTTESPVDPALVTGAIAAGVVLFSIRRR